MFCFFARGGVFVSWGVGCWFWRGGGGLSVTDLPHFFGDEGDVGGVGEIVREGFHAPEREADADWDFDDEGNCA